MQLRKVNVIAFINEDISNEELGQFIKLLCKHEYDMSITFDGYSIVVEYDDAHYKHLGNPVNVWVDPEELEEVLDDGDYDVDEDDDDDEDDEYYDEDDECDDDFDDFGDPDFDDDFRG